MIQLDVFLEGSDAPIGRLSKLDSGASEFRYLTDEVAHPISLSLPVQEAGFDDVATRAFFDNLLFENMQRDQVMQRHGLDFNDTVGLLAHLGRDCPGAISVVPQGDGPAKMPGDLTTDYDPIDPKELIRIMTSLRDTRRMPNDASDPSPLAGVQGKLAVTRLPDGRLALPKPGLNVPTTHILKVPRQSEMRLVDHEHLMMQIAATAQAHPVATTEIIGDGDVRGLLITRFDRVVDGTAVRRVHQEDFCQALGLGPMLKYQRNGDPARQFSAEAMGRLVDQTDHPAKARQALLEGSLVNLLLGNTDNHAKNHGLIYHGARPEFAPFYDIVPVVLDDSVTHQLSFDIGAAQMSDDIGPEDLEQFVRDLGYRRVTPALRKRLQTIAQDVVAQIDDMRGPIKKRVGDVIAHQAAGLETALGLDLNIPERDLVVSVRP